MQDLLDRLKAKSDVFYDLAPWLDAERYNTIFNELLSLIDQVVEANPTAELNAIVFGLMQTKFEWLDKAIAGNEEAAAHVRTYVQQKVNQLLQLSKR